MAQNVPIRTPGELFKAIEVIKHAVADGDIEEIDAGPTKAVVPFEQLSDEAPLDDFLLYRFRCPLCGQNFALSVETMHGSGGSWDKAAPLQSR